MAEITNPEYLKVGHWAVDAFADSPEELFQVGHESFPLELAKDHFIWEETEWCSGSFTFFEHYEEALAFFNAKYED
jgi:hypothetical protein